MANSNEVTIDGFIKTIQTISGSTSISRTSGSITSLHTVSGSINLPKVLDRTAIHYDYTEAWNAHPEIISEVGNLYIYRDYKQVENPDGTITDIPAIKIGDGTSYLIDMPFVATGDDEDFIDHINNWSIHVSGPDRTNWDQKVSANVDEAEENLILSF